jgi:hypothetical protein
MKNSTISTAKQIQHRINQLNSLIQKFPNVRSLIRRWGFELTQLEGRLETLKAVVVVEKPIQLTIWDAPIMEIEGTKQNPINIFFKEDDELLSLHPREGSKLCSSWHLACGDWIDESGTEYDGRDKPIYEGMELKWLQLRDGRYQLDPDLILLEKGWEWDSQQGEPVKIKR